MSAAPALSHRAARRGFLFPATALWAGATALAQAAAPGVGNPDGNCVVPAAAQAVKITTPTHVIGTGTPASCTGQAVVQAVAQGGSITFNCGPKRLVITLPETAKVFNDRPDVTLDGGGRIALSGGGVRRILYQNTCDPNQVWTTGRCDIQDTPRLTVQNIDFVNGNSTGQTYGQDGVEGGGAIFARGGRLKVVNSRFFGNRCEPTGPDLGGGAVRATGMTAQSPVYVTNSTFGGAPGRYANQCSNGGALSGLFASYAVYNSLITDNRAEGYGANPAKPGTPGGGSGGGLYQDGLTFDLTMCGTRMERNQAQEGGGAIFFVSNDLTGTMALTDSFLSANPNLGFQTAGLPGIFVLAAPGQPVITRTTIQP